MTLEEARRVVRDDSALPVDWFLAAAEISSSRESSLEDLLVCLRRKGTIASGAATTLYVRTKRPRKDDSVESFSMDYQDWLEYLRDRGLVS
jgi:hypothetical protein